MTEISPGYVAVLVRATAVLALPPDDQVLWLSSLGLPGEPAYADELVTEFDDAARLVGTLHASGWLSDGTVARLRELERVLDVLGSADGSDVWALAALRTAPEWGDVRAAARRALFSM